MLVGIDASRAVAAQRTGTENYSLNLIRELAFAYRTLTGEQGTFYFGALGAYTIGVDNPRAGGSGGRDDSHQQQPDPDTPDALWQAQGGAVWRCSSKLPLMVADHGAGRGYGVYGEATSGKGTGRMIAGGVIGLQVGRAAFKKPASRVSGVSKPLTSPCWKWLRQQPIK